MNERDQLKRIQKSNEKWLKTDESKLSQQKLTWIKEFKKRYGHKNGPR